MKTINSKSIKIFAFTLAVFIAGILSACSDSGTDNLAVSTLTRPMSMAIAVIDWTPSETDEQYADYFDSYDDDDYWGGFWAECLSKNKRGFGFVANSGNNSVARIDLCTGEVINTHVKGNPFVVSHIPVGKFPVSVATSVDEGNTRVFVSNGGEHTLSVIMTKEARTLQDKVELSSTPSAIAVVASEVNAEGDVYVALAEPGKLARVRKYVVDGNERWYEDGFATLKTDLTPSPLPGGMVADPNGEYLYVSDMNSDYFHVVDLKNPEIPAQTKFVDGPQKNCSISPDGRFLYLPKMDSKKIAVYDLQKDEYVDTNSELPSHFNSPAPSELIDYDIEVSALPKAAVFVDVGKVRAVDVDGDADFEDEMDTEEEIQESAETDGDIEVDGDMDTDGDTEISGEDLEDSEDSDAAESEGSAKFKAGDEDGDLEDESTEEESETETVVTDKKLYAYSIGYNGNIQVVDVHNNLHELYDTDPSSGAELALLQNDEFQRDNGLCLADLDVKMTDGVTPHALWELAYNGIVPESDLTVSGRFEFENSRFVDSATDFSALEEIHPRPADYDPDNPKSIKGDWLEILTAPNYISDDNGCFETIIDDNGNSTLTRLQSVKLEILEVTPDYITYDSRGIDLKKCFNTAVSYQIRANENYIVYMTKLDSMGNRLSSRIYQGRAINTEFSPSSKIEDEDQFSALVFDVEDWEDFVCTIEKTKDDGTKYNEYMFRQDMALAGGSEIVDGMECLSGFYDDTLPLSFENELIQFAVCQDMNDSEMQLKRQDTFIYSFRTYSGVNEILQVYENDEGESEQAQDRFVGSVLEDAVFSDLYEGYPFLYVVDSSEEIVYVIDLSLDEVVRTIQ